MVLSNRSFVLGWGGGGSVAIGRYSVFVWVTVVGIGVLCAWSMIGGSRSPGNHASLWGICARTGGDPCGDTWSQAVSLVFSTRTDML